MKRIWVKIHEVLDQSELIISTMSLKITFPWKRLEENIQIYMCQ